MSKSTPTIGNANDSLALIRQLIWLYLILWLIEGGLRRWFLPGLATPLLLIRDPLAILIYALAASKRVFPTNIFIVSGAALAALSFISAIAIGHGNPMVALYGVRCDFLDVPLVFIMGQVLRREDLLRMAKVAVWVVIPYTALLVAQFKSPQSAWVNRGVGGDMDGAGFSGALGHFRPPGTFSFITGPATLYPILTACWFILVLARKMPGWLMIASGSAILIAMPISISRVMVLSVAIVVLAGVLALFAGGQITASVLLRSLFAALLIPILASQFKAFNTGLDAFEARWQNSTVEGGGFEKTIVDRVIDSLFGSFDDVGVLGLGTGYSTNVGQKLLTNKAGFGASEGEWGRLLFDNGLILGSLMVLYRAALAGVIVLAALRAWQKRSPEALIFASASFLLVLQGQWGQASTQGAAAIAGGLTLAAAGGGSLQSRKKKVSAVAQAMAGQGKQESEVGSQRSEIEEAPFSVTKPEQTQDHEQRTTDDGPKAQRSVVSSHSSDDEFAPFSVTKPKSDR